MQALRMKWRTWAGVCAAAIVAASLVQAQPQTQTTQQFEPTVGQAGKDVVWVPTPQELVDKMLDMAKVTPQDFVMDLGSGDGRTVITAAKRGARAMGIEYNPDMVALSQRNATAQGVTERVAFVQADLFETDLSQATVITMFLLPDINLKLRPKILDLRPGTRVVSNTFSMEEWEADETYRIPDCPSWCTALLWIVPAKVSGTWKMPQGELMLTQRFQMITGTLRSGSTSTPVTGKLNGESVTFAGGGIEFTGRVTGNTMTGTARPGGAWTASRAGL